MTLIVEFPTPVKGKKKELVIPVEGNSKVSLF